MLYAKLAALGVCSHVVGWVRSFLENHLFQLGINDVVIEEKVVPSDVTQCSLLFMLIMNELSPMTPKWELEVMMFLRSN